jgi:hypothetical protein
MKRLIVLLIASLVSLATFSATNVPVQLISPTGSSSGQAIVSTGASSAPAWGGIGVSGIAAIAANTVLANSTGSSASPTAISMPSCSTSLSILQYTTSTGFTCNTSIWGAPPNVGFVTPGTGNFTTLNSTSGSLNGSLGQAIAFAGTFTTLKGNSLAKVQAVNTGGQTIASATTYATVTGWTTVYDANSNFNTSTGTFTAPATGDYFFSCQTAYASLTGGAGVRASTAIFVSSTNALAGYVGVPTTTTVVPLTSGFIHLTSGNTVTCQASQNSGSGVALSNFSPQVSFSVIQVP